MSPTREVSSRRRALAGIAPTPSTHPGLWLDRWVERLGDKGAAKRDAIDQVLNDIQCPSGALYSRAFQRWHNLLQAENKVALTPMEALSRIIVGIGSDSVLETSITLHQTYGVPLLPGTALKGLARRYCLSRFGSLHADYRGSNPTKQDDRLKMGLDKEWGFTSYDTLFGHAEGAGGIVFHDAWLIPDPRSKKSLLRDVITVHHPEYYGASSNPPPPADWDDPNPVSYLTVAPGACFLVAIQGADDWRKRATDILCLALEEEGIGAKTTSGYGRLESSDPAAKALERCLGSIKDPEIETYWQSLENRVPDSQGRLRKMFDFIMALPDTDEKRNYARALLSGPRQKVIAKWEGGTDAKKKRYRDLRNVAGSD
ncbi:MAG: type III-B CRISPR module RAMP protein Cmr6 [Candidatus Eisenbacteria bacterium]